ncbi:nuclear transport factor 2 family protein [Pseudonocardia oroxyli]|uniref:SnoaL-like domain-containing protein n=1 Tax=Pseudonocardia oroxyli TaxID=366584 RepID=A0A1G7THG3_PSEOR|nr:nuclear transport factor 2 family protein [Pseudonocardia oroxyli]SDG34695.1 SnoaL-like domain-containing protein [Pseudonocardia oroxyli]
MTMTSTPSGTDEQLAHLLAEAEIKRLLYGYCRAVDRGDLVSLREVYHPDAVDEHSGVYSGDVDGFITQLGRSLELGAVVCTRHCLSNIVIEIEGDVAVSESYFDAYHRRRTGDGYVDEFVAGRYLDRLERRAGTWRIAARQLVWDSMRSEQASQPPWDGEPGRYEVGRRSADDISVAWFRRRGPGDRS